MNISLDKAILWLLPYLYLVSIAYYWGYWGTFDIDAFSYYAVADLVKGVTAPIASALAYSVIAVIVFFIAELISIPLNIKGYGNIKFIAGFLIYISALTFLPHYIL